MSELIPLSSYPNTKATYRGVLRSITDLKQPQPYQGSEKLEVVDKIHEFNEQQKNVPMFRYGEVLNSAKIVSKGFKLAMVKDTNDKSKVANYICDLLNNSQSLDGILLIGISTNGLNINIVEGVEMTRQNRDRFRIGLDALMRDVIVPMPSYDRFELPVFIKVANHPKSEECFVIRLTIKPCNNEEISYTVRKV